MHEYRNILFYNDHSKGVFYMSHKMIHMAKFDKVVICCKVVSKTVDTGVTLTVRSSVSLCYDNYLFINTVS